MFSKLSSVDAELLRTQVTNWHRIMNTKRTAGAKTMAKRKTTGAVDNMAVEVGVEKTGTFKITVSDDKTVLYSNEKEPFTYREIDNFADCVKVHGGELSEDQITFLGEVFSGESNGAALKSIIEQTNGKIRDNAKSAAYQKLVNQYKPMSEEDERRANERMVELFAKLNGITVEAAKAKLDALKG